MSGSHSGFFLVFEGPEGSGKSTQIRLLAERLRAAGRNPLVTREPGGTAAGDAIRRVVLDPELEIGALAEFLLYSAGRAQHVEEVIRPALAAGRLVVSDRFAGASLAYQGYGRGLDTAFVRQLNGEVTGGLEPDMTVLLDLEPEAGLARVAGRGQPDRLERADLDFHRRVRRGFLAQAEADPRWVIIGAQEAEAALAQRVWQALRTRLEP